MARRKRQPYAYNINGTKVTSWRKLYRASCGTYCHRQGDYFVPVSPALLHRIAMAQLGPADEKET